MERKLHPIERNNKGIRKYKKNHKIEDIKEEKTSSDEEKINEKHNKNRSRTRTKSPKMRRYIIKEKINYSNNITI